jgi:hypothetical protein
VSPVRQREVTAFSRGAEPAIWSMRGKDQRDGSGGMSTEVLIVIKGDGA